MKNKLIKKVITLTLASIMLFTTTVSAVTFTDISDHWAKDYIKEVAELGIVTGYEDNTFRPDKNVTLVETLVMLSRLYEVEDDIMADLMDQYGGALESMDTKGAYEWAYKELAVAMELNIVTQSNLESFFKTEKMGTIRSREEIAVFLTKAMMLEDEASQLTVYTTPFNDVASISASARPYVHMMYTKGILTGDDEKNLKPKGQITRAQLSAMLIRAYDYIVEYKVEPEFTNYKPTSVVNGVIEKLTEDDPESFIDVKINNTETVVVRISSDTKISIDDKKAEFSDIKKGNAIDCKIDENRIAKSINVDTKTKIVEGTITYVAYVSPMSIAVTDSKDRKTEYKVNSDTKIILDGKEVEMKKLSKRDNAVVQSKEGIATRITAESRVKEYKGKIKSIEYDIPIKLTIISDDDKTYTFEFQDDTEITRNKEEVNFSQIRAGDEVTLVTEYNKMTEINATAVAAQLSGTITEIITRIEGETKIKISNSKGEETEYLVSSNVKISLGSKNGTINDLRVGYDVDINLSGDEIVTIEAAEIQSTKDFLGKVILIDESNKLLIIQNTVSGSKTETLNLIITNDTKIINMKGSNKYLKDINKGDTIKGTAKTENGEYKAIVIMIQ